MSGSTSNRTISKSGLSFGQTPLMRTLTNTRIVPVGVVLALSMLTATTWSAVFPLNSLIVPAVVSIAISYLALQLSRKQGLAVTFASVVASLFVSAHLSVLRPWTIARTGFPSRTSLRLFGDAFRNGWSRILTSPIPMSFDPDRSLVFVLTVVVGSSIGLFFATRTRFVLASVTGPALILLLSRLLGATAAGGWTSRAVALGISTAFLAALTSTKPGRTVRSKTKQEGIVTSSGAGKNGKNRINELSFRGRASIAVLLVALLGALIAGVALPSSNDFGKPFDPRRLASTRNADVTAVHPLSYVAYWAQHPTDELFSIRSTTKQPPPARWRIAVLDRFDGVTWLPETRYVENGAVLPSPSPSVGLDPASARKTVRAQVMIKQLPDRWLPTPGWPIMVTGVPIEVDARHGMIQQRNGTTRTGLAYAIEARPLFDTTPVLQNGFDTSAESLSMLEVPSLSPDLANIARTIATGATTAQQRAQRLAVYLQSRFRFNENAQPGHGYARLVRLLRSPGPTGDGGTSEQFASAFAVMARSLGIPTRLVIGFTVDPTSIQPGADGTSTTASVRAVQAQAWPEVRFANVGWVPFFPTPLIGADTPIQEPTASPADASIPETTIAAPDTTETPKLAPPITKPSSGVPTWLAALLGAVILFISALGLSRRILLRRRQTRRSLVDREAIFGAWEETRRVLEACQQKIRADETLPLFVERCVTDARWNDPRLASAIPSMHRLADVCQSAQYRRELPATNEIDQAWRSADEIQRALTNTASIRERAQILFDARS